MQKVTIAMVGLGGYGNFYLARLFAAREERDFELVAGVDPNPVGCRYLAQFESEDIPIYPDLDAFYAASSADLVIIAAPIQFHKPFTLNALGHGSNVLCEKPVAATVQEALAMAEAEANVDEWVGIGYQWSFSEAIQNLKKDIMAGEFGEPLRLRTKVLWPRPKSYYARNSWAGLIRTSDGRWVLDSPANNATAHYLHNCFYVLGETRETSARPADVQAELYRANPIENYDTAAIRCHTASGAEILFYTAHPLPEEIGPTLVYEFERGVVDFDGRDGRLVAHFTGGRIKDYGNPFVDGANKLWQSIDAVRTGAPLACGIEAASSHTRCVNAAQESMPQIVDFPEDVIRHREHGEDVLVWVEGLQETLEACYDQGVMPSELGASWARSGRHLDLTSGYDEFPSLTT